MNNNNKDFDKFRNKDFDLYYYKYNLNDGMLSWVLIPIAIFIIYNKTYITYFSYIFIYIALIGIIETLILLNKSKYYLFFSFIILLHSILLYPLLNIKKYLIPNISNFIFGLIAILIIIFLPYWPYFIDRNIFIYTLIMIYIFIYILYKYN